ncbi:MAG: ATP-binding protein [Sterolibacterium sp.]|jgi:signal transduction histidine kinase
MNSEASGKPVVLIVDDNVANIEVLGAALAGDYEIHFATSGAKGLQLAARVPPDLVLLDVMMPAMDGFEACRRLRADRQLRDIPVIFISALGDVADKVKAFQAGGSDYVTKPFQAEEVLARVATHVALYRTRRKLYEREEKLRRNLAELDAAHARLKEMSGQLLQSEKMASLGQLAAGVAHEINNPIGFVNSNLGSLQRYTADLLELLSAYDKGEAEMTPETRAALAALKKQIDIAYLREDVGNLLSESMEGLQRVKRIVQDLKDFSHVDDKEKHWANLEQGLDSTLNVVANELKYKAEIVKEYAGIPEIECLPSQLNQVFMNLLMNAVQAIDNHGRITIRTGQDENNVWVDVEDTGKGIEPEHLGRIFEPFFTTKPVGSGTGLGLSLSYGIVQQHGGRIEVKSEPGKGSDFRVVLPRQSATDDHGAPQSPVDPAGDMGKPQTTGREDR